MNFGNIGVERLKEVDCPTCARLPERVELLKDFVLDLSCHGLAKAADCQQRRVADALSLTNVCLEQPGGWGEGQRQLSLCMSSRSGQAGPPQFKTTTPYKSADEELLPKVVGVGECTFDRHSSVKNILNTTIMIIIR